MATTTPGGGWPDATNTGLPPGVTLTPSGDLVITKAGTVISGLNIQGTVTIEAANVTLENCTVTSAAFMVVNIAAGVTGAVVQNCEINGVGSGNAGSCGINGQGTFIGNNIYNVENGINVTGSSVIENNYIHGLQASGSPHYDGIQIDGGVSNITISHNTVVNDNGSVSAIMIDNYWGAVSNISVDNNLLVGGGFTVYDDGHFNSNPITGVSFTNNHMGSGGYGITDFNGTKPTYTGNVNDGAALAATLNTAANSGGGTVPTAPDPGHQIHPNDLTYASTASGANHFIDLQNFEASFPDLIKAFGSNIQAMQTWYNTREPTEQRVEKFDGLDYIASYSDLISAFHAGGSMQAVEDAGASHYISAGLNENRTTTFNGLDYIASYSDLIKAFGANSDAGAFHFIEHGSQEGRATTFDGLNYIASYGDLIHAFGANEQAGAAHFISNGSAEGRTTTFDGLAYIAQYTDLMKAIGANNDAGANHYITSGVNEGRNCAGFNVGAYEQAHPDLIGHFASNDAFLTAYINTYHNTGAFLV